MTHIYYDCRLVNLQVLSKDTAIADVELGNSGFALTDYTFFRNETKDGLPTHLKSQCITDEPSTKRAVLSMPSDILTMIDKEIRIHIDAYIELKEFIGCEASYPKVIVKDKCPMLIDQEVARE